ncbi:F-type H+-transporting ATPase subunit delta [Palleronia aestuarii]|uniref:ATP synthase subunit delta n=1 Tax=Palleronia aestuarii TaxID=568105 RepID=A0A2W7N6S9_9RHOB|nr:F-type H+-transporting ATPase subunit delta [Palleronia aestuarii]
MSEPASISTGIASRYAIAIFELAKEDGSLDQLRADTDTISSSLNDSEDFRDLIHSPLYARDEQQAAISAIAERMELSSYMANTLRLMASKRRLFVLPELVRDLRRRITEEKGEITADVTAATELTDEQRRKLAETLKSSVGRDVNINLSVDESLIGGLVVKVGSKMIDTSIRSKLNALQNTMREVG